MNPRYYKTLPAWVLVMLYDLIHGVEVPTVSQSRFSQLTKANLESHVLHFGDNRWDAVDSNKTCSGT